MPEHVARNRVSWDEVNAPLYAAPGARAWARQEITWGIFGSPEDELDALPADVAGMDVVELGCGTAYFGAWLARRGARVTGIDNSAEQLKTARGLQDEHDLHFPLIYGNAPPAGCRTLASDVECGETAPTLPLHDMSAAERLWEAAMKLARSHRDDTLRSR